MNSSLTLMASSLMLVSALSSGIFWILRKKASQMGISTSVAIITIGVILYYILSLYLAFSAGSNYGFKSIAWRFLGSAFVVSPILALNAPLLMLYYISKEIRAVNLFHRFIWLLAGISIIAEYMVISSFDKS